mmetsp:Transcript_103494/g.288160  ORF Transcript_103494/g.288160 Transcript_103494/m.288160 type:complete len:276 (-) Transcript_103494:457-1284(-)
MATGCSFSASSISTVPYSKAHANTPHGPGRSPQSRSAHTSAWPRRPRSVQRPALWSSLSVAQRWPCLVSKYSREVAPQAAAAKPSPSSASAVPPAVLASHVSVLPVPRGAKPALLPVPRDAVPLPPVPGGEPGSSMDRVRPATNAPLLLRVAPNSPWGCTMDQHLMAAEPMVTKARESTASARSTTPAAQEAAARRSACGHDQSSSWCSQWPLSPSLTERSSAPRRNQATCITPCAWPRSGVGLPPFARSKTSTWGPRLVPAAVPLAPPPSPAAK